MSNNDELPPGSENWSPLDLRTFQLKRNEADMKCERILASLPPATPANAAAIGARLDKLTPFERQRFDKVLRDAVAAKNGGSK